MSKTKWHGKATCLVALALVLSLGIVAMPIAGTVEASCAPEVWVDDDADPGWYDATHVHTIQEGVNAVCEGGTVHVFPGKYAGGIVVDKANVTIESANGPEVTIVDPTGDSGFNVSSQGVTIDGFNITGFGGVEDGPFAEGTGDSPQINYNSYAGYGIHLFCGGSNCIIRNNIIENNSHGIGIETDNNQILLNDILANVAGPPSGIHLGSSASGNVINCNNIEGNLPYGVYNENTGETVDVTHNWWGNASGPSGEGTGSGDAVSTNVDYSSWLPTEFQDCEECVGAAPAAGVPAMSYWGLIAMIALFAGFLVWAGRRMRASS